MDDSDYNDGSSLGEASMSLSDVSMGEASMIISSDDDEGHSIPYSPSLHPSAGLKRLHPDATGEEDRFPLKRRAGIYSHAYVHTLNSSILEAAARCIAPKAEEIPLYDSQFGLTYWTANEKQHFFSLIGRLGRDNLPAIARELTTKDELEMRQFIVMLDDAVEYRRDLPKNENRDKVKEPTVLRPLHLIDIPAAAEIGEEGDGLLESVADALAIRQEKVEDRAEKHKWGGRWRITLALAKDLSQLTSQRADSGKLKGNTRESARLAGDENDNDKTSLRAPHRHEKITQIACLFNLPMWLRLSERVFMNGGMDSDDNWRLVGAEKPSIRATALEDMHTLIKNITRKLVLASLAIAEQRIRLAMGSANEAKPVVRQRDVRAAIASTGMKQNAQKFWRDASRRLQLDVLEREPKAGDGIEPMEYDEIEDALAVDDDSDRELDIHFDNEYDDESDDEDEGSDLGHMGISGLEITGFPIDEPVISAADQKLAEQDPVDTDDSNDGIIDMDQEEDEEELEIRRDIKEIMTYSAVDYPESHSKQEALRDRIVAEREREDLAEMLDMRNSRKEELRLWGLLKQRPPTELTEQLEMEEDAEKEIKTTIMVDDFFASMSDWRDTTRYESEWEGEIPRTLGLKK